MRMTSTWLQHEVYAMLSEGSDAQSCGITEMSKQVDPSNSIHDMMNNSELELASLPGCCHTY